MNWLILLYFLELGYSPFYQSVNVLPDRYESIRNENVYYIDFDAEVLMFNHFFIGGSSKTFIQPDNEGYSFYPIQNDYLFKTGFRYKNIQVGFNHFCTHPGRSAGIISRGTAYGGYEEFYIRISNKE